jgi:hypothetical protein
VFVIHACAVLGYGTFRCSSIVMMAGIAREAGAQVTKQALVAFR